MELFSTETLQMIEDRLNLNSVNQKLIAGNLANINTPGYRAKEVSFESALRESLQEHVLQMVRSNGSHVAPDDPVQAMHIRGGNRERSGGSGYRNGNPYQEQH